MGKNGGVMSKRTRSRSARNRRRRASRERLEQYRAQFASAPKGFASDSALDEYELACELLAPRGPVPMIAKLSDRTPERLWALESEQLELLESRREFKRERLELEADERLVAAEDKLAIRWIQQPVPNDAPHQRKRSVLANTEYVCYLSDDRGWYIDREIWAGLYDDAGNRIGVQREVWLQRFPSEASVQRAMLNHLRLGHNLEYDDDSELRPDRLDLRDIVKNRGIYRERKTRTREPGYMPEDTRLASNLEHTRS